MHYIARENHTQKMHVSYPITVISNSQNLKRNREIKNVSICGTTNQAKAKRNSFKFDSFHYPLRNNHFQIRSIIRFIHQQQAFPSISSPEILYSLLNPIFMYLPRDFPTSLDSQPLTEKGCVKDLILYSH